MSQELSLRIVLEAPPAGVDFGLQKGSGNNYETVQKQKSDASNLEFEFTVTCKLDNLDNPNFLGAFVQGPPGQRFIYIDIGTYAGQLHAQWGRRLKIPLVGISTSVIKEVLADHSKLLEARVAGTGKDGGPNCATVKPFSGWHITLRLPG